MIKKKKSINRFISGLRKSKQKIRSAFKKKRSNQTKSKSVDNNHDTSLNFYNLPSNNKFNKFEGQQSAPSRTIPISPKKKKKQKKKIY